jgi:hypothetical protein
MGVKQWVGRTDMSARVVRLAKLEKRVRMLEEDVTELRRHGMRVAELTDLVQNLLVPMAAGGDARVQDAIEKFNKSV